MLRLLVLLHLVTMFSSCATGRSIGPDNNVVQMPTHSFTVPPERGWVANLQKRQQHTYLQYEDREAQVLYRVGVFLRTVDDAKIRTYTAQELAELYFRNEKKRVLKADGGRYTITCERDGTEEIGGRTFYTCMYETEADDFEGRTDIFLLMPHESGNKAIVAVESRIAAQPPLDEDRERLEEIRAMAASLVLDEKSFAR